MSDNRKTLLIALGAGAALITAALAYHFISQSGGNEGSDEVQVEVSEQLKAQNLDEVKKDANGTIDSQYFLKLLQFVGATTRE
jgi:hypothetical protein